MRRFWLLVLFLSLVRPDAAGAGIDCTTPQYTDITLGILTSMSRDCEEGGQPTTADHLHIPLGSGVTVDDDLDWVSGTERGLSCYGSLTLDAATLGDAIELTMGQGQTDLPGTDAVNFYAGPTCQLTVRAGYGTFGVSPAALENEISREKKTIWNVPYIIPCGTNEDTIGQIPDVSGYCTGARARNFCFQWPLSVMDPEDGNGVSEGYIEESVVGVDDDVTILALTGMAAGTAWTVRNQDVNPDNDSVGFCIDHGQMGQNYTNDSGDNPVAERAIKLAYVEAAVQAGATCVSVASSAGGTGGVLTASGHLAGWCFRPEGDCECHRVTKSTDGTDCAGGSDDAFYFAPEDPLPAMAAASKATLDMTGFECGDEFALMHGVNITVDENRTEGDGWVVLANSTGVVDGLTVTGAGIDFDSIGIPMSNVFVFQGGDGAADKASMTVSGTGSFALFNSGVVGSGTGAGSGGIHFDDFEGPVVVDSFSARYKGDYMIESIGDATNYIRDFNRIRCEWVDHGSATALGCLHTHGDWGPADVVRWYCGDCTTGDDGSIFAAAHGDIVNVRSGLALGITSGGLVQGNEVGTGDQIRFVGVIGRGATGTRALADGTLFGRVMHGFNFDDWYSTSGTGAVFPNAHELSNGRLTRVSTPGNSFWRIIEDVDLASRMFAHNIEIVTPGLSNADPALLTIDTDGNSATCIDLRGITFRDHTGADGTTGARYGVYSFDDGSGETCFDIDQVTVANIDVTGSPGDFTAFDIAANLIALIPEGSGRLCASANTAAGTYLAVDDIGDYDIEPELSWRVPVKSDGIAAGAQPNRWVCTGGTGKGSPGNSPVDSWVEMIAGFEFGANVYNTEGF